MTKLIVCLAFLIPLTLGLNDTEHKPIPGCNDGSIMVGCLEPCLKKGMKKCNKGFKKYDDTRGTRKGQCFCFRHYTRAEERAIMGLKPLPEGIDDNVEEVGKCGEYLGKCKACKKGDKECLGNCKLAEANCEKGSMSLQCIRALSDTTLTDEVADALCYPTLK